MDGLRIDATRSGVGLMIRISIRRRVVGGEFEGHFSVSLIGLLDFGSPRNKVLIEGE